MANSGCFKKGHKETPEINEKRRLSNKMAWPNRKDYHGMYGTKFYNSWRSMTTRCRGTAGAGSKRKYKDKGISVCEKWLTFKGFYEDMYPSYIHGYTIDRIDNGQGYCKENCRWADPFLQAENRYTTVRIDCNGESLTLREISKKFGINLNGLRFRYHHKYSKGMIGLSELITPRKKVRA